MAGEEGESVVDEVRVSGGGMRGGRRRPGFRPGFRSGTAAIAMAVLMTPLVTAVQSPPASAASTSGGACQAPAKVTPAEQASTVGVTSKSVTVGNVATITGPVPGLFEGAPNGVRAYFDYVNSQGGVDGRKLLVDSKDDGFSAQQNASETQSAVASDFAMVGDFSLFDTYGCPALAANPAVADVSVTLDPATNALPNDFSAQPLSQGIALGALQYLKKKYPHDLKVGTIVSTTATAVAQWQGEEAGFEHEGYTIAYQQKISPLTPDYTTEVIKMRDAGVNFVYVTDLDWQAGAILTKDMAEQNWHPAVVMSGGPIYADQFIAKAGGAADTNGFWLGQGQALYLGQDEAHVPADKLFLKWIKKAAPTWTPDLFTLYGWASAQMFVQALKAAGPHPTRGALLAQLDKITNFNASGLLAPVNPAKKTPASCYLMARIENGKYVRVFPSRSGFSCNSTYFTAAGKQS
jgi:ABC-type branched-subunit amino acid transport system substrate-binding protein